MTTAAPTGATLASVAGTAETVIKDVMEVEPFVATFIPGSAIFQPFVMAAAPFVEQALTALSQGNNGDLMTSFIQLLQHLTPTQPNAPILSQTPAVHGGPVTI